MSEDALEELKAYACKNGRQDEWCCRCLRWSEAWEKEREDAKDEVVRHIATCAILGALRREVEIIRDALYEGCGDGDHVAIARHELGTVRQRDVGCFCSMADRLDAALRGEGK